MADTEATTTTEKPADTVAGAAPAVDGKAAEAKASDTETVAGGKTQDQQKTEGEGDKAKPEVPEKYELKLPEGMQLDEKALEEVTPVLKELGITNEGANKLVPIYTKMAEQVRQHQLDQWVATNERWINEIKSDPSLGATEKAMEETKTLSGRAIEAYTDSPEEAAALRQALKIAMVGNNPSLVRFFRKVGDTVTPDTLHRGKGPAPEKKTDAEVLYGGKTV